ncbi:hypothetical protein [uncultured Gammaproteobacteria bacterium]|nr:hypothetical protein [uncultured Gammaproteobacteria bacterium]
MDIFPRHFGCFRWVLFYQVGGFLVGLCKGLKGFNVLPKKTLKTFGYYGS